MSKDDVSDLNLDYEYCLLRTNKEEIFPKFGEPDQFLIRRDGEILVRTDDDQKEVTIGTFSLMIADIEGAVEANVSAYDVFDTESASFRHYEALYDGYDFKERVVKVAVGDDYVFRPNLLMLERLTIYPEYRGQGLGLTVLRMLIERYRIGMGLVSLKPFPLQFEVNPMSETNDIPRERLELDNFKGTSVAATRKLKRYYEKLGFKSVSRTEYMVRDATKPFQEA
jgi:GNAT superfamily N-acetyltransferase